ncbi:hypothetical protein C4K00_2129 [Pseudomonas synxantha]|uniref:IpaC/SipC family type III secretion system effector n=1 Tax=Pseudomonas synxantha TaxID=47883 RepID=UPI000F57BFDD|nr:IpaC/SipC family type III secretion system effector [Pseudomonas synxantha]AZE72358.1 hypothetical protein C4K00_2129 [Pseudomonas synxantha]
MAINIGSASQGAIVNTKAVDASRPNESRLAMAETLSADAVVPGAQVIVESPQIEKMLNFIKEAGLAELPTLAEQQKLRTALYEMVPEALRLADKLGPKTGNVGEISQATEVSIESDFAEAVRAATEKPEKTEAFLDPLTLTGRQALLYQLLLFVEFEARAAKDKQKSAYAIMSYEQTLSKAAAKVQEGKQLFHAAIANSATSLSMTVGGAVASAKAIHTESVTLKKNKMPANELGLKIQNKNLTIDAGGLQVNPQDNLKSLTRHKGAGTEEVQLAPSGHQTTMEERAIMKRDLLDDQARVNELEQMHQQVMLKAEKLKLVAQTLMSSGQVLGMTMNSALQIEAMALQADQMIKEAASSVMSSLSQSSGTEEGYSRDLIKKLLELYDSYRKADVAALNHIASKI